MMRNLVLVALLGTSSLSSTVEEGRHPKSGRFHKFFKSSRAGSKAHHGGVHAHHADSRDHLNHDHAKPTHGHHADTRDHSKEKRSAHDNVFKFVDCKKYPAFCDPKVDCNKKPMTIREMFALNASIVGRTKHANLRSWCLAYPNYETTVQQCVLKNDLVKNAEMTFATQKSHNLDTADAIYCELAGLCKDTLLNVNSTQKDSERVCNLRFRNRWKKMGWKTFMETISASSTIVANSQAAIAAGKTTWAKVAATARKTSLTTAMTACAMGSYHCDVYYCKKNYCGKGKYAMWSHIAWNSRSPPKLP